MGTEIPKGLTGHNQRLHPTLVPGARMLFTATVLHHSTTLPVSREWKAPEDLI